jgi:hypothetical protein
MKTYKVLNSILRVQVLLGALAAVLIVPTTNAAPAQQAYLKASNTHSTDYFGSAVALSDDTLVVGAQEETSRSTGVNGDEKNIYVNGTGAAYVFVRKGTNWTQQAYLKESNTDLHDKFGYSVAVSGDTVVVGAYAEDSNATDVNGNQGDNSASASGAAYVFVRKGTNWTQQAYLKWTATAFSVFASRVSQARHTMCNVHPLSPARGPLWPRLPRQCRAYSNISICLRRRTWLFIKPFSSNLFRLSPTDVARAAFALWF